MKKEVAKGKFKITGYLEGDNIKDCEYIDGTCELDLDGNPMLLVHGCANTLAQIVSDNISKEDVDEFLDVFKELVKTTMEIV